ncbi:hypothetical protein IEQ34_021546 [Dendrobium chrysotoxum]|uniref:Uncharacterized protein n=1 Tax=Dendrobium chrysotoxum TaxID=161865 RepID=A0AAV7FMN7_DENCH|nr:hypothetical protein IEQ34_021546 [Dendrobium chrysotoxum]
MYSSAFLIGGSLEFGLEIKRAIRFEESRSSTPRLPSVNLTAWFPLLNLRPIIAIRPSFGHHGWVYFRPLLLVDYGPSDLCCPSTTVPLTSARPPTTIPLTSVALQLGSLRRPLTTVHSATVARRLWSVRPPLPADYGPSVLCHPPTIVPPPSVTIDYGPSDHHRPPTTVLSTIISH